MTLQADQGSAQRHQPKIVLHHGLQPRAVGSQLRSIRQVAPEKARAWFGKRSTFCPDPAGLPDSLCNGALAQHLASTPREALTFLGKTEAGLTENPERATFC